MSRDQLERAKRQIINRNTRPIKIERSGVKAITRRPSVIDRRRYRCAALRKFMRRYNNVKPNIAIDTQSHINTSAPRN